MSTKRKFVTGIAINPPENIVSGATITVHLSSLGVFHDQRYGRLVLSKDQFNQGINNFKDNVVGRQIFLDAEHKPEESGGLAVFKRVYLKGDQLLADVTLTEQGVTEIKDRGRIYCSIDADPHYVDKLDKKEHGFTLLGAALTTRPVIPYLDPIIRLSEQQEQTLETVFHQQLIEQKGQSMKFIDLIKQALEQYQLSSAHKEQLLGLARLAESKDEQSKAKENIIKLAESMAQQAVEAKPTGGQVIDENFIKISIDKSIKAIKEEEDKAKELRLSEQRDRNELLISEFKDSGLTDEQQEKIIKTVSDSIQLSDSDSSAVALAQSLIAQAKQESRNKELGALGFDQSRGNFQGVEVIDNNVINLSEKIRSKLRLSTQHYNGEIKSSDKVAPIVEKILQGYDRDHAQALASECRILLATGGQVSQIQNPVLFRREVLRESLQDDLILSLVNSQTDEKQTHVHQIPYEILDRTGIQLASSLRTHEFQAKLKSGVTQRMHDVYVNKHPLVISMSDELALFGSLGHINFDAWARNVASASQLMKEAITTDIMNRYIQSSDLYSSIAVSNENIAARLDGTNSLILTQQFPIIRPYQNYTLEGATVGNAEAALVLTIDGTVINQYDPRVTAAGTYYVIENANLGAIRLVNETGAYVTPNETTATISYSYSNNVGKFDLDLPNGVTEGQHMAKLERLIGSQKVKLNSGKSGFENSRRYARPNMLVMGPELEDKLGNSDTFTRNDARVDASMNSDGTLQIIKGLPVTCTNSAAFNDLGNERIHIGERNTLMMGYSQMMKMSDLSRMRNANGELIGGTQAEIDNFYGLDMPKLLRQNHTGVVAYSALERASMV